VTNQTFNIQGLGGEKKLKGKIRVNGAKNAVLKAISASILFDGKVILENVPMNRDVQTLIDIMKRLGANISVEKDNKISINTANINTTNIDPELARSMRASVVLTGPLLARYGEVSFPAPGGCVIGERPIDLFVEGYKKMGATVENGSVYKIKIDSGKIGSTEIFFNKITVCGTETMMLAGVLGIGKVILKNCAMEPEIESVAGWLNECGANIKGAGTHTIEIIGTNGELLKPRKNYKTIPDRIEAGSFLILGALCASELTIEGCEPRHMEAVIEVLKEAGVSTRSDLVNGQIAIINNTKPNSSFKAISDLRTHEYPGFPTDLQACMTVFLTQVTGTSNIFETIYENRFKYVDDLKKISANITVKNHREIAVEGPTLLYIRDPISVKTSPTLTLTAHDIRAGFALVLAGLVGKGEFTINNVELIDRGYERLEERLREVGAEVRRE
jgi:UDP-N-acetylglucosamine 1-carboxyvinyltransferase